MVSKVNIAIALMGKADLTNDIIENIISMIPQDKNCKSPVVDLIHNDRTHGFGLTYGTPNKCDGFTLWRQHILFDIHEQDLRANYKNINYNFADYNSVVPVVNRGTMILGEFFQVIYEKDPDDRLKVIGYYDKSKFRPKYHRDSNFQIVGFCRKGVKGGGMISAQQTQEESTYNGWYN